MGKKNKAKDDYWDAEFESDTVKVEQEHGLMAILQNKQKKVEEQVEETSEEPTIKSKKQKEKERKERLKLEKKKQQPLPVNAKQEHFQDKVELIELATNPTVSSPESTNEKIKKKPTGAKSALKEMLAARKRAEEEERLRLEEEEKLEREELKRLEQEEIIKQEARLAKKERERLKKEQLRKEGKLLTKSQREAKQKQELKLQQLLASGVKVAALEVEEKVEGAEKKKVVYGKKKKVKKEKEAKEKGEAEDHVLESWEDAVEDDEHGDGLKETWDDEASSPVQAKVEKPKVGKGVEEKASVKKETVEDSSVFERQTLFENQQQQKEMEMKRKLRHEEAVSKASTENLRSPICCILGHVDTGKTKLLDKIRQTNVQEGEAGGITQQIGATYFPIENIRAKTDALKHDIEYNIPGLLVIDTPGHESFTNLRSRGSSLCNIAILVIDIMHGLEPQTIESIRLLKEKKAPFVVALNKIDRLYQWNPTPDGPFVHSLEKQESFVKSEFRDRLQKTILALNEQGLNAALYYENKNMAKNVSLIPTSAITGEGIPDLLYLLVQLTQTRMSKQLMFLSELEATVLEVKVIQGLGTTIDVILSNGVLKEGDRIVVCGLEGPIATNIRAVLTPQPLRELRVKAEYIHHKQIKAAMGVKICAPNLEKAIAGSRLLVVGPDDDEEELMDDVMEDLQNLLSKIDKTGKGVYVQSSTLGSLEALLEFLQQSKIPVSGINIGPVHKKDVTRCSVMLEHAKEFAVMLCFDIKVEKEARELADELGVRIFTADIIYHLFDQFKLYHNEIAEQRRKDQAPSAVFPCILRIIPGCVFNKRDPIILGVDVVEGILRIGTPICVVDKEKNCIITLGKVTSIEQSHKPIESVKKGQVSAGVAIRIECASYETPKLFGRHFVESSELYSKISRESIDILKESFKKDLTKEEWGVVVKLKKILGVA